MTPKLEELAAKLQESIREYAELVTTLELTITKYKDPEHFAEAVQAAVQAEEDTFGPMVRLLP